MAVVSVGVAAALGAAVAARTTWWLLVALVVGAVLVPAYNLELFGGRFHSDPGFALAWGAFPVLTGYVAQTETIRAPALLAAAWAVALSLAQRRLSTPARHVRRDVVDVDGGLALSDGRVERLDRAALLAAPEAALRLLTWATVLVAASLALLHVD